MQTTGINHQTISKSATNETLSHIRRSPKDWPCFYHMALEELIEYNFDEQ